VGNVLLFLFLSGSNGVFGYGLFGRTMELAMREMIAMMDDDDDDDVE
jgi:hypothetical protein